TEAAAVHVGLLRPAEGLERATQEAGGKALAAVDDVKLRRTVSPRGAEPDLAGAVVKRVVDQIAECLLEQQPVGTDDERISGLDRDRPSLQLRPRPEALGHRLEHVRDVHRLTLDGDATLLGACEQEEVVSDARESFRVLGGGADRGLELLTRSRTAEGQLELGLEQCEWSPQLVTCIRDEAALARETVSNPAQHLVQGRAEARDLVLRVRDRQPVFEGPR